MLADTVIGDINAIFIEHNFDVKKSLNGLIRKVALFVLCGSFDSIIILENHFKIMNLELKDFIGLCFEGIILIACYTEVVSILSNISIITGVDFSAIPAVQDIIENKKLKRLNKDKNKKGE